MIYRVPSATPPGIDMTHAQALLALSWPRLGVPGFAVNTLFARHKRWFLYRSGAIDGALM